MDIDPRLIRDISHAESPGGQPNLVAYKDSKGNWTIGFGHLMADQNDATAANTAIDEQRALALLKSDISDAKIQAAQTLEWPYLDTACRQNAVIELIFNMGEHRWMGFVKCRAAIRQQDWPEVKNQLLDSEWAPEVHPARANRLANYLLTGAY